MQAPIRKKLDRRAAYGQATVRTTWGRRADPQTILHAPPHRHRRRVGWPVCRRIGSTDRDQQSGLFAHFESKEKLEPAAIEPAAEILRREVLAPCRESRSGLGGVEALAEARCSCHSKPIPKSI